MTAAVLQGDSAAFRLADVLSFLSTTRKSGTLSLAAEGREATLFIDSGALVFASSSQERFRLGSILLRKKKIGDEDRDRIDALMRSDGGRFGDVAIEQGVLTADQLRDFLKVQVSEIVYDAFVWDDGTFSFVEELSMPEHAVTIAIDLGNLIMEGARRIDEWEQCLRLLPDENLVFRVVTAPRDEKITLTADEWKLLFLINGVRTIAQLCLESEEDALHVWRVLYGLYANKLIEPVSQNANADETGIAASGDATVRQTTPRFGAESTVREELAGDDTSLLVSLEARLSYSDVVRPTIGQLTIPATSTVIPLTEPEHKLGRHRDNDIQIADLGVSGFHARIYRGPDGYVLEDLKSRNGTWLNSERIQHATLTSGDHIHVGETDLIYNVLA